MVAVDDIVTDSLGACIGEWFEAGFGHRFLDLKTISVPDSVKPIPKRWVEDVEIGMDEGFAGEEADVMGEGPTTSWTVDEGRQRLRDSLARLGLREEHVAHADLNRMSRHELANEKRRVKQELKRYDAEFRRCFRRLPSHTEKEPMRPLYVYYRRLKTMIAQAEQARGGGRRSSGAINSDDEGEPTRGGPGAGGLRFGPRESAASLPDIDDAAPLVQRSEESSSVKDQIAALEARIDSLQNEKGGVRAKLQSFQCYVACLGDPLEDRGNRSKTQSRPAFATGNWGCGAFGGDPQLKVLIQWLAASASDRELRFCPFDDPRLEELPEVVKAVWDSGAKCSDLYKLLYGHKKKRGVFNGLQKNIEALKRAGVLVPRPPEQDSGDEEGGGDGEYGDESAEN